MIRLTRPPPGRVSVGEAPWQPHKPTFRAAQHDKCGYCEAKIGELGAVEHYAPKGRVDRLELAGHEVDDDVGVRRRVTPTLHPTGYDWLEHSWDNWLFACERCNSGWKRCLIPVRDPSEPPSPDRPYDPLLLMPYDGRDPAIHLRFDDLGAVTGTTDIGDATIETVGLHRPSLVRLRMQRMAELLGALRILELALNQGNDQIIDAAIDAVRDLLSAEAPFAGAARSVAFARLPALRELVTV